MEIMQTRERITLPDSDFIDLDWSYAERKKSNKVIILLHGLRGHATTTLFNWYCKIF